MGRGFGGVQTFALEYNSPRRICRMSAAPPRRTASVNDDDDDDDEGYAFLIWLYWL